MTEFESITFFINRYLGNKLIVETLRGAGLTVEVHDDHLADIFLKAIPEMKKFSYDHPAPSITKVY